MARFSTVNMGTFSTLKKEKRKPIRITSHCRENFKQRQISKRNFRCPLFTLSTGKNDVSKAHRKIF